MKKITAILLSLASLAITAVALDCEIKPIERKAVIEELVPIEYRFTPVEVADALRVAIKKKYPNADLTSSNFALVWYDRRDAGHVPVDGRWESLFEPGRNTNNFALVVRVDNATYDWTKFYEERFWISYGITNAWHATLLDCNQHP